MKVNCIINKKFDTNISVSYRLGDERL